MWQCFWGVGKGRDGGVNWGDHAIFLFFFKMVYSQHVCMLMGMIPLRANSRGEYYSKSIELGRSEGFRQEQVIQALCSRGKAQCLWSQIPYKMVNIGVDGCISVLIWQLLFFQWNWKQGQHKRGGWERDWKPVKMWNSLKSWLGNVVRVLDCAESLLEVCGCKLKMRPACSYVFFSHIQ